jgi:hypothetical protein
MPIGFSYEALHSGCYFGTVFPQLLTQVGWPYPKIKSDTEALRTSSWRDMPRALLCSRLMPFAWKKQQGTSWNVTLVKAISSAIAEDLSICGGGANIAQGEGGHKPTVVGSAIEPLWPSIHPVFSLTFHLNSCPANIGWSPVINLFSDPR